MSGMRGNLLSAETVEKRAERKQPGNDRGMERKCRREREREKKKHKTKITTN